VNTGPTRSATAGSGETRTSLTTQILVGLAAGALLGAVWPGAGVAVKPLADAFLRMIKMIIAPLLFSTLVVGIAGTGDLKTMGRIGALWQNSPRSSR
jgi:Na+/H+-dicarboxylate symporter